MIAVGNNELGKELGKTAKCPACSRELDVQSTGPLNTVKCSCGEGEVYLIGMNGREINQSTPDHTEDKLDMVKKPGMRLTHHEKAIYDTRVYNDRLYDFAMRILIELKDRHEFSPSLFDKELISNAFHAAARFLDVGIEHEQDIDRNLEWADVWEEEDSESEEEV